ncbi:proclotting enzyme-like [Cydia pomonella]|uniref:proclotting enzyme-like n=1 Tax=Cydia pomonella TaxID=82600 RepID=UPI002ADE3320|nr:proclotting enzyme-like [Cydia pomonella]XP_061705147.1 proclotting enzyme-like [Cydia pomonella]XP_061705148.1 proclotting enzyme-like [Cydia pomonella]
MSFSVILLLGILLTCEGLEQSSQNWHHLPPALFGSSVNATSRHNDNVIRPSPINVTTEELKKLRWPQTVLDDYADYMLRNYTTTMDQTQKNLNYAQNQMKHNHVATHVFSTEGIPSNWNITTSVHRPLTDGEQVSLKNRDSLRVSPPKSNNLTGGYQPGINNLVGGEKLTSVQAPFLQWHVGVYSKEFEPYMQICGGTLVTTKAVISAAHCFWSDVGGALPASRFVIAAGKLYRPWTDNHDLHAQKSEVSAVQLPPRFHGAVTSFQDDIAVVLLATAFTHSPALRPLCVLFDEYLEHTNLRNGKQGVVLGWGLTAENGPPAQALQYLYMPYVPIEECVASTEPNFLKYITSDKICAGVTTGKALCRGDSGGGLVFFDLSTGDRVPLLFGVASTAPRNEHLCNTHARATLTRVLAHRVFLRTHIPDIEETCMKNYVSFASDIEANLLEDRTAATHQPPPARTKLICNCYCNNSTKP